MCSRSLDWGLVESFIIIEKTVMPSFRSGLEAGWGVEPAVDTELSAVSGEEVLGEEMPEEDWRM